MLPVNYGIWKPCQFWWMSTSALVFSLSVQKENAKRMNTKREHITKSEPPELQNFKVTEEIVHCSYRTLEELCQTSHL